MSGHFFKEETRSRLLAIGELRLGRSVPQTFLSDVTTLFGTGSLVGLPDRVLVERFLEGPAEQSEAAFSALVDRHGLMVLRVCRQIVGDAQDAEDAAQATFLLLARKARSIRGVNSVSGWLYGVAVRTASRMRRDTARRRRHELRKAEQSMTQAVGVESETGGERWPELYEELARLPERFRLPVVLCHLEGLTYEQAAERLCCPVRTVHSRLSRAKERLRYRLARRGVRPTIAVVGAVYDQDRLGTGAAVSESWKQATVAGALRYAAGGFRAGVMSSTAGMLAEGVSRTMELCRLMRWATAVASIGVVAISAQMRLMATSERPGAHPVSQQLAPARGEPSPAKTFPRDRVLPAPASHPFRLAMAGGVTFEIVGVSALPIGPKTWWRPDGSPLEQPAFDPLVYQDRVPEEDEVRVVLARVSNLPDGATFRWLPTFDSGYSGPRLTKDGQKVPELEVYLISVRKDRVRCEVNVKLAAGEWKREASDSGRMPRSMNINGRVFYFGKARPLWNGNSTGPEDATSISVAHSVADRDMRLAAIDLEGKEKRPYFSTAGMGEFANLLDTEFRLARDQIKEFRVMSRPFELAVIKNIELQPREMIGPGFFEPQLKTLDRR